MDSRLILTKPYCKVFKISPEKYENILIADLPFSVRTINALKNAGIYSIAQLLNKTEVDVSKVQSIGAKCLKEIRDYFESLDTQDFDMAPERVSLSVEKLFIDNRENLIQGNFGFFQNLSDEEKLTLDKYKAAYNILDKSLIEECCYSPNKVYPIMNMLYNYIEMQKRRETINSIINKLPSSTREAPISLILNLNKTDSELLCACTDINRPLNDLIINSDQLSQESYTALKRLVNLLQPNIGKNLDMLFDEYFDKSNIKTIIEMRSQGFTLEEAGSVLGVTRERVRQIEAKAKRVFKGWNQTSRVLLQISIQRGGDTVLTEDEIENYLGNHAKEGTWFLKDSEIDFIYERQLKLFLAVEENLVFRAQQFIDTLPDYFSKDSLPEILTKAESEWRLPKEIVEVAILDAFTLTASTYHRARLSLTSMYSETLNKYFQSGMYIYDSDELLLFKDKVRELFGDVKLPQNERALSARIADISILCGRGKYMPKKAEYLPKDLTDRIYNYIIETDSQVFLMNTLYYLFEDELLLYGIDNKYFLQGILRSLYEEEFFFSRDYISKSSDATTIHSEIVNFIKKSQYPVSKLEIQHAFPGVTDILITFAITESGVLNYFGEYLHASKLNISHDEKIWLKNIVDSLLSDNTPHHTKEIYDIVFNNKPELLSRNSANFQFSLYSILEYVFNDVYQFSRPYISNLGVKMERPAEILRTMIYSSNEFIVSDITAFSRENRFQIISILDYVNSCNDNYLLINQDIIASIESIGITQEMVLEVENIIAKEVDSVVPIRDLKCIASFPDINVPWHEWLIYSILNKWSSIFEVAPSSNQFRMSIPLVSPKDRMDVKLFNPTYSANSDGIYVPDNLDDIDSLIADIIDDELMEDVYEL